MVLLLLTCLAGTAAEQDRVTEYGPLANSHLVEEVHEFFAKALQIAIFVHMLAVIALDRLARGSRRGMITRQKRVPAGAGWSTDPDDRALELMA